MSALSSLFIGISGVQAQSNKIASIADNLANINTVGYKKSGVLFHNLLGNDSVRNYSAGGAGGFARHLNNGQGIITGTTSSTDIAISGKGYFPVRPTALATSGLLYTRAGSFTEDLNGDLYNGAGFYLQGWRLTNEALPAGLDADLVDSGAGSAALETVNVRNIADVDIPTTTVSFIGNLTASKPIYAGVPAYDPTDPLADMSNGIIPPTSTKPVSIITSLGDTKTLTAGFLKTGPNTWAVEIYADNAAELGTASAQVASGTLTFNGDGTLASVSGGLTAAIGVTWAPVAPSTDSGTNSITFNWGTAGALGTGLSDGLAQLDAPFRATANQNGFAAGSLRSISFTNDGFVVANYNNGTAQKVFKIPLAEFPEQDQLQGLSGNVFAETAASGDVSFTQPGDGGFGTIYESALESSNVDTAEELTEMIVAQRNFQFNTRIIDTADKMLETANQMLG
jgi:flagellar hook protein FlgE